MLSRGLRQTRRTQSGECDKTTIQALHLRRLLICRRCRTLTRRTRNMMNNIVWSYHAKGAKFTHSENDHIVINNINKAKLIEVLCRN